MNCEWVNLKEIDDAVDEISELCLEFLDSPTEQLHKTIEEKLDQLKNHHGRYYVVNVFSGVWMGVNEYGIHGCTPCDVMHSLREGILLRVLKTVTNALGTKGKNALDSAIANLLCRQRCKAMRDFPKISFNHGITNLTNSAAHERVGQALALVIFLLTDDGYDLLLHKYTLFYKGKIAKIRKMEEEAAKAAEKEKAAVTKPPTPERGIPCWSVLYVLKIQI